MTIEQPIVNLSGVMGDILFNFIQFFGNMIGGWFLILILMTSGFIMVIYFRFIKNVGVELGK